MAVVLFVAFLFILSRLFKLQIIQGSDFKKRAESQHVVVKKLFPSRGEIRIFDREATEGYVVATNIKKFLAYVVPQRIQNLKETSVALAGVLGMKEEDILLKISDKKRKYIIIKKQLTQEEQKALENLKIAGVYLDTEDARYYPEQNFLSQTLGFVGYKDETRKGLYGLEKAFEEELAGKQGLLNEEKDTSGAWIFGGKRDIFPAEDGVNLLLTIDKGIQYKAESVIKETVEKHGADSGSVVVLNPKTGAILAIAGYPDFDPNEYNKVKENFVFSNQAAMGSYEPGSIFKPLTMAAAINEGKITPETKYTDKGVVLVDGFKIKNSDGKAHGVQTMTQVLEESLNTGVIFAKEQIGNSKFLEYVKKFGFGSVSGVELTESKGNLDNLKGNIEVNYDTASFGQGILVTPLQMIKSYIPLANEGKLLKPFLVQTKIYSDGQIENFEPHQISQVLKPETASAVTRMLVQVVEEGHGKKAGVPGYFIAGKTGTAQVARSDGKGYEENNNIGSFIGYGPADDPQFLMLVRVNHPRSVQFAESTAAPAFGEIAQFILNYFHIPPTRK